MAGKKLSEDQVDAIRATVYFLLKMCKEQRVRIRKDMAGVVSHAWDAVRNDTDGPAIFDDAIHKQRSNLILPENVTH